MTEGPPIRLAELRTEIASRLEPVCADWPPERFDALVEDIATITFRYEILMAKDAKYDRGTTERLIEDMKNLARRSAGIRQSGET